jgi:hypothetical protein
MCLWCGITVTAAVAIALDGSAAALIPTFMLAFGLTLGYRLLLLGVDLAPDELVIRNSFRTWHVAREDVDGFRVGEYAGNPFVRTIYLLTRDGAIVPLEVAARPYRGARGQASLAKRMGALQGWLARP